MSELKVFKVEHSDDKEATNIILLHGYGASGRDLMGIAQYPELESLNANWYFLEAPLAPPELQMFGGLAWFNLTLSSFGPNLSKEDLEKFFLMENAELSNSLKLIQNAIWNLNLNLKNTFIGGFSQGAMMATRAFFDEPEAFKGLISMSGAPVQHDKWKSSTDSLKIFISHGQQDPVLPFACAENLLAKVKTFNPKHVWFNGGHEIPPKVLNELSHWLKA